MKNIFKYLPVLCCSALLIGCSLFSEETREIEKSYRKTTFSYPDKEVFGAVVQILTEDGYRIKKKNLPEGIIETFPKKNKGLFAKAFSGGLYRTTVNSYLQRVNPEKTLVMLSMKIEQEIVEKDENSFEEKLIRRWEKVEVIEDQLSLLGNDTYENYFSRIERTIRKNRSGGLLPASLSGQSRGFLQTHSVKPAESIKSVESSEPKDLEKLEKGDQKN